MLEGIGKYLDTLRRRLSGFTLIELLAVCAIMLIVMVMAVGSVSNVKRFSAEEKAVSRLRQLADAQERYRFSCDPTVNPEGTFGTFAELQLANLIPDDFVTGDITAHTVNAFIPYYRMDIARSPTNPLDEPDTDHYYIVLYPIANKWRLRTFYMLEDGEIYHSYGLRYYER